MVQAVPAADEVAATDTDSREGLRHRISPALLSALLTSTTVVVLGAVRIGRSFSYDEGFTFHFFINGGSVRRALTTQIVLNNHSMFSATQAVLWRLGFVSESTQRLGPVMCGAAAVGLVTWYAGRRAGWIAGVGAAVVLALNPVFFGQIRLLRGYALATFMVVVAGLAIARSWTDHRRRWLVIQGACMTVAVTAHAYSALTLLMFAVAALALGRVRREHLVTWSAAAVAAIGILSPILDDMRTNASARGSRYFEDFPVHLLRALTGTDWPVVIITMVLVCVGLLTVGGRSKRHAIALGASGAVLAGVVLVLWLVVQPLDLYFRFFVSLVPVVAVLAGIGMGRFPKAAQVGLVVVVATLLAPAVLDSLDDEPTIRDGAQYANRAREAGFELCARHAEPLFVYTPPMRLINGIDDFESCEVYISVLRLRGEPREAAVERFTSSVDLGGTVVVWADEAVLAEIAPAD